MAEEREREEEQQREKPGPGDGGKEAGEAETGKPQEVAEAAADWEADLDEYPLRDPDQDPRWAVRTVWGWVGFALFSLVFTLALLILGFFYE